MDQNDGISLENVIYLISKNKIDIVTHYAVSGHTFLYQIMHNLLRLSVSDSCVSDFHRHLLDVLCRPKWRFTGL